MSVDLTFWPIGGNLDAMPYANAWIGMSGPSVDVYEAIDSIRERVTVPKVYVLNEETPRTKDAYGDKLRAVRVGDLGRIKIHKGYSARTHATFAYLRALDPGTWIVLYWH